MIKTKQYVTPNNELIIQHTGYYVDMNGQRISVNYGNHPPDIISVEYTESPVDETEVVLPEEQ